MFVRSERWDSDNKGASVIKNEITLVIIREAWPYAFCIQCIWYWDLPCDFFLLNSSDSECHWMKKVLFFMTTLMIDIYREIAKNLLLNDNKWLTASSFYRQSHFRIYTRLPETLMLKSVLWLRSGHDTIGPCYTLGCINNHGASCSYEFIVPCISVNRLACFISLKFSSPACFWQPQF